MKLLGSITKDYTINILKWGYLNKKFSEKFILSDYTMFKLGSYYEVNLKILVDGKTTVKDGHNLMDDIEHDLLNSDMNIKYVNIHIEPLEELEQVKKCK